MIPNSASSGPLISDKEKREALSTLLQAKPFESAARRRDFLTYVVEEEIAGRGPEIRGKTIAQDVYGRDPFGEGDPENVVRVDARRLRDILALHYETDGQNDPVRIRLDSGGYCPAFERVEVVSDPVTSNSSALHYAILVLTLIAGIAIGTFITGGLSKNAVTGSSSPDLRPPPSQASNAQREAVYDKSVAALQAVNLAEQARGMIFPIFDRARQNLVASVFNRVIELDQDYYGGYAGSAQAIATIAILTTDAEERESSLQEASKLIRRAIELEPANGWSQSSLAWCEFAKGNYNEAFRLSSRAVQLDPADGHVLDLHGAIALFSGHFEEAVANADRGRVRGRSNQRFANRNIFAAASFHLGNYADTISGFEEAASFGDPISAPALAYHAAALNASGNRSAAKRKLMELSRAWPDVPLHKVLHSVHGETENAEAVLAELRDLGWLPPEEAPGSAN